MLLGLGKFQQVQYECNALPTTLASRKERENSMHANYYHGFKALPLRQAAWCTDNQRGTVCKGHKYPIYHV